MRAAGAISACIAAEAAHLEAHLWQSNDNKESVHHMDSIDKHIRQESHATERPSAAIICRHQCRRRQPPPGPPAAAPPAVPALLCG